MTSLKSSGTTNQSTTVHHSCLQPKSKCVGSRKNTGDTSASVLKRIKLAPEKIQNKYKTRTA